MNLNFISTARAWGRQKLRPALKPAHTAGDATPRPGIKARVRRVSARLSHAVFVGLIAVALLPSARPSKTIAVATANHPQKPKAEKRRVALTVEPIEPRAVTKPDTTGKRDRFADAPIEAETVKALPPMENAKSSSEGALTESDKSLRVARADVIVPPVLRAAPMPLREIAVESAKRAEKIAAEIAPKAVRAKDATVDTAADRAQAPSKSEDEDDKSGDAKSDDDKLGDGKKESTGVAAPVLAPIGVVKKKEAYTVVDVWTEEQIADGRSACQKLLSGIDMVATDVPPVKEGACGAPAPVQVRSLGKPKVDIQPSAMLTCPMAAALATWITDKVQPAAIENFGVPVARLLSASSYSCRNRYGQANTPLSEHALVNALDLSGFVLSDGRTVRVLESWGPVARDTRSEPITVAANVVDGKRRPKIGLSMLGGNVAAVSATTKSNDKTTPPDASKADDKAKEKPDEKPKATELETKRSAFLHKVHAEACDVFGTVLGPEANEAHRNHFHLDMKARRHKGYCQ